MAPLITGAAIVGTITHAERYAGHLGAITVYIVAYFVVRSGLSACYLVGRPNMSIGQKWLSFFVGTPAAVLLNVFWLTPIRYWALFRLRDNRWRTREVSTELPPGTVSLNRPEVGMAQTVLIVGAGPRIHEYLARSASVPRQPGPNRSLTNPAQRREVRSHRAPARRHSAQV